MNGDQTGVEAGQLPDAQRRIRELNYLRTRLGIRSVDFDFIL
jgi:hypothetical protein